MDGGDSRPGFVGRAEELARLEIAMGDASGGHPRVVIVAGEAGVGKSRLLDEALERWRSAGVLVLEGACLQLGPAGPPYAPVVGVLRSLRHAVEPGALAGVLGPGRGLLGRLVPDLVERAADIASDPTDATSQVRLFELVAGAIERLARRAPLVVAVEDIHWADPSSRDLFDFLVRGVQPGVRLLFVGTLRTDALEADDPARVWAAELSRLPIVERIDLGPLGRAEVAQLVGEVLGRRPDPAFVDRVMERANGNAFLSEELAAFGDQSDGALPAHLREILLARLAPVAPATRDVLRAAAASGRRVDDELLSTVLAVPGREIDTALREAVSHGILLTEPATGELRFRHPLVREAVASELFTGERRRLHLAFATALEDRVNEGGPTAVRPEELAYHWDAAGRPDRAAPAHLQAARAAARVYAWAEASRRFDRALALEEALPSSLPASELPDVLLEAANAWGLQGAYDRAVELARRAVPLVDATREPERAAAIHQSLRWFLWEAGDLPAAAVEVAEALRLTPAAPPSAMRARAVAHAAGLAMSSGDVAGALRLANEAVDTARAATAPPEEALGLGILGWAMAASGDVDGGASRFEAAMAIARGVGSAEGVALGYTNLTAALDRAGRTAEALALAEAGFAEVERYGLARTFGVPLLVAAARMHFHQGRWDEVDRLLERARSLAPLPGPLATIECLEARLDAARGRFDAAGKAVAAVGAAEESSIRGRAEVPSAASLQARIEVAVWAGDLAAGRRVEDAAMARPLGAPLPDPALAWVAVSALRIEADAAQRAGYAHDDTMRLEAIGRIAAVGRWLTAGLGGDVDGDPAAELRAAAADARIGVLAAQCRAEAARAVGDDEARAWDDVAQGWERLGRPLHVAYARYRQAEVELRSGSDRDAARASLRRCSTIAAGLGAAPLLDAARRLARLARIDLGAEPAPGRTDEAIADRDGRPPSESPADDSLGLTTREREVLRLVADGWSNPEIADELGISPKTASVHVSNLLAKLGVPNRVEAAVAATRLGLVEVDGAGAADTAAASVAGEASASSAVDRAGRSGARSTSAADGSREAVHRAFLFTDIVGSTPLVEAIGDRAWRDLLQWHDGALRREFERHHGREVDHAGDGFFVVFRSAREAVGCAIDIQRMLAAHRTSAGFAPTVRIGVHAGDAVERGAGYVGAAVHVAARIAARAEGDRILASAQAIREAGARPDGALVDASLPGVAERVRVGAISW